MSPRKKPETRLNRVEVQLNTQEKAQAVELAAKLGTPVATVLRIALNRWVTECDARVDCVGKRAAGVQR